MHKLRIKTIKDSRAALKLHQLIAAHLGQLKNMADDLVLIAEASSKYSEGFDDDVWIAVRVGDDSWEQSHLFMHRQPPAIIQRKRRNQQLDTAVIEQHGTVAMEENLTTGRSILRSLRRGGWQKLADKALGYGIRNRHCIQCLAIQHGQTWLCRSSPVDDSGDAWLVTDDQSFIHFGETCRLDAFIAATPPIFFRRVNDCARAFLSNKARQYFSPEPVNSDALQHFTTLLIRAAADTAKISNIPVEFLSRYSRFSPIGRLIVSDGTGGISWNKIQTDFNLPFDDTLQSELPLEIRHLGKILARLEKADWRAIFGEAFGAPLVGVQMLTLFVNPACTLLVRENSAWRICNGTLKFAGLCDMPAFGHPEQAPWLVSPE